MDMEENYGFITVVVTTANGALPVEQAVVTIKDAEDQIVSVLFTDQSGMTQKLKTLAPPPENSIFPGRTTPFYTYKVSITKDQFIPVENISVPVYPGITSIQPVDLMPAPESGITASALKAKKINTNNPIL